MSNNFISESPCKTPKMTVFFCENEKRLSWFYAPEGFQLEKFVASLYPHETLVISFPVENGIKTFRVAFGNKTYIGYYK